MRGQHFSVMDVFYGLVNHLYNEGSAKCIICPNSGMKNEALDSLQNLDCGLDASLMQISFNLCALFCNIS